MLLNDKKAAAHHSVSMTEVSGCLHGGPHSNHLDFIEILKVRLKALEEEELDSYWSEGMHLLLMTCVSFEHFRTPISPRCDCRAILFGNSLTGQTTVYGPVRTLAWEL